jgi:chlorobactene glucosyltransferase
VALVSSVVWLAIVAWLIGRALRQNFAFRRLAPVSDAASSGLPSIAVVVPARDEAENIGGCLSALASQDYPAGQLRIIVADDHSTDMTAAIVSALGRAEGRLGLVRCPEPPAGWIGKTHACWLGSRAAPAGVEWLCFLDADVRAEPALLATAVKEATDLRLDFLSLTPRQELESFAERLIMPCGFYLLAFRQDLNHIQASADEATATGQFILVRRAAYERIGGHAAVRQHISEDAALARIAKRCGFRVALAGGDRLLSTRMYTGWRSLWLGVSKNLADMMGGPVATAVTAIFGVMLAWTAVLLPLAELNGCARGGGCIALVITILGSAALFGLHLAGSVFFRIPVWYGLLFPLGYTAGALIALDSVRRRLTGRRVWKGRVYP